MTLAVALLHALQAQSYSCSLRVFTLVVGKETY